MSLVASRPLHTPLLETLAYQTQSLRDLFGRHGTSQVLFVCQYQQWHPFEFVLLCMVAKHTHTHTHTYTHTHTHTHTCIRIVESHPRRWSLLDMRWCIANSHIHLASKEALAYTWPHGLDLHYLRHRSQPMCWHSSIANMVESMSGHQGPKLS
jgi:hypothetical protein